MSRVQIDDRGTGSRESEALLLSGREAARLLGISERKLWDLGEDAESGIGVVRIGRRKLYSRERLEAWIARRIEGVEVALED